MAVGQVRIRHLTRVHILLLDQTLKKAQASLNLWMRHPYLYSAARVEVAKAASKKHSGDFLSGMKGLSWRSLLKNRGRVILCICNMQLLILDRSIDSEPPRTSKKRWSESGTKPEVGPIPAIQSTKGLRKPTWPRKDLPESYWRIESSAKILCEGNLVLSSSVQYPKKNNS